MGLFRRRLKSGGICRRLDNCNNSERSSRRFIKTTTASSSPTDDAGLAADMMTNCYQILEKRDSSLSSLIGHRELSSGHFWISVLGECLSCYLYVFIVCSTRISWTGSVIGHEPSLLAMGLSSGLAMMLLIMTFRTVHVNPALSIAFLMTGRIPLLRAIAYVSAHCLGSVAATTCLYCISVKGHAGALGLDKPHEALGWWQILIVEMVISFVVTLATYATCNYSSYTQARKFVLDQATIGQNRADLIFCDPLSSLGACDNSTAPIMANSCNLQQASGEQQTNAAPQMQNKAARQGAFRVHPQQATGAYLADVYANSNNQDELKDLDYEFDYANGRVYANSQQQQQIQQQQQSQLSSANSGSPPVVGLGGGNSRAPPMEELIQNECQLLATNGFSLQVTIGQALVIGLAYTLASLTGIPASGASLNPARSFGPAFIMNRWQLHWIYWLGPISGAVIAGFFYEFIFNPTKESSLCYLPKLFRLSAHDMAKVCSKSRLFHQQQQQQQNHQKLSPFTTASLYPTAPSSLLYRPHLQQQQQQQKQQMISPNSRLGNGFMSSATLAAAGEHHRHPAALAQLQASHLQQLGATDSMGFFQQQQQQALLLDNFDRSKSSAIINLIASKQQQSTINLPQQQKGVNSNFHSASSSNGSSSHASSNNNNNQRQDFGALSEDVVYDDPTCGNELARVSIGGPQIQQQQQQQFNNKSMRHSMMLTERKQLAQSAGYWPKPRPFQTMHQRPQSMLMALNGHDGKHIIDGDQNHHSTASGTACFSDNDEAPRIKQALFGQHLLPNATEEI